MLLQVKTNLQAGQDKSSQPKPEGSWGLCCQPNTKPVASYMWYRFHIYGLQKYHLTKKLDTHCDWGSIYLKYKSWGRGILQRQNNTHFTRDTLQVCIFIINQVTRLSIWVNYDHLNYADTPQSHSDFYNTACTFNWSEEELPQTRRTTKWNEEAPTSLKKPPSSPKCKQNFVYLCNG